MPYLTDKDLEEIEIQLGEEWRKKIEKLQEEAEKYNQFRTELEQNLTKIFSKPEAKRYFEKAVKEAGIEMEIPKNPLDEYYEKISKMEKELETIKTKERYKEKIMKLIEQYGIPEEEFKDLIEFQEKYKIWDNERAIELYAIYREKKRAERTPEEELEPIKKAFLRGEKPETVEDLYKKTMQDLKKQGLIK
ncbi:MAG: hypothetical protein QXJ20_02750 [Candidatus Aenigmatarchaeota archaeon]